MNILFVCTYNRMRSLTAEHIFRSYPGWSVKSAGTSLVARIRINAKLIKWAEVIYVMETKHLEILRERFRNEMANKQIICLDIPDEFGYMDETLVEILKAKVLPYSETH